METDLLTVQENENLQKLSGKPSPLPREELKDFYVKLARLSYPTACSSKRSDFEVLNTLRTELKKSLRLIGLYTQHEWGEGVLEIQTACGLYSVEDTIPKKDRLEMNTALGKHLQFIMQLSSASTTVRKMQAEYTLHISNVNHLLKQFSNNGKDSGKEKTDSNK